MNDLHGLRSGAGRATIETASAPTGVDEAADAFEKLRPLLRGVAYRMLGSVSDAQDVVQDAWMRYQHALEAGTRVESPGAYLVAMVTRLSIDNLRSARVRRERYVGLWLPEPVLTNDDSFNTTHQGGVDEDTLSMAFMILLERLNAMERAVFLLHEVFGYSHGEIASMLGKSEVNVRRIASRARKAVHAGRPRFDGTAREREDLASRFFAAVHEGDVDSLVSMLAEDVVVCGDGGGKAPQWSKPIEGVDRVARLLAGLGRRIVEAGGRLHIQSINGHPGAMVLAPGGLLVSVFSLEIREGAVHAVRSIINPDKLQHLGPVADVRELLKRSIQPQDPSWQSDMDHGQIQHSRPPK